MTRLVSGRLDEDCPFPRPNHRYGTILEIRGRPLRLNEIE